MRGPTCSRHEKCPLFYQNNYNDHLREIANRTAVKSLSAPQEEVRVTKDNWSEGEVSDEKTNRHIIRETGRHLVGQSETETDSLIRCIEFNQIRSTVLKNSLVQ